MSDALDGLLEFQRLKGAKAEVRIDDIQRVVIRNTDPWKSV
jgi:hypothetical protein